jgi:predicted ArsR family transcriptional regulator
MDEHESGLAVVSSLDDPVRRRLYEFVSRSPQPVGRDEAAAAVGIGRPLAAYHLDKLAGLGLLTASYQRPAGRAGPGAGRPAKVYTRSGSEFSVTVPPRDYELAARLLAAAVEADRGGSSRAALRDAAQQFGAGLGERSRAADPAGEGTRQAVEDALRGHGFEPFQDEDGTIRLRNCPFHHLAAQHRDVVCGMNLALIEGLVAGLRASGLQPVLHPQPGQCCVAIGVRAPSGGAGRAELS